MEDALNTRASNEEVLNQVIIPEFKVPQDVRDEAHMSAANIDTLKLDTEAS
jgi:hypothetical protein